MSSAAAATRPRIGRSSWRATAYAPPPPGKALQTWRYEIATTASRIEIAMATGTETSSAPAPASTSTRRISSVA